MTNHPRQLYWLDDRILVEPVHWWPDGTTIFEAACDQRFAVRRYCTSLDVAEQVRRLRPVPRLENERQIAAAKTVGRPWVAGSTARFLGDSRLVDKPPMTLV